MCDKCLDKTVEALKKFNFKGDIIRVTPFGSGIINDTFLVVCNDKGSKDVYKRQALDLGSSALGVGVRLPSSAPIMRKWLNGRAPPCQGGCLSLIHI